MQTSDENVDEEMSAEEVRGWIEFVGWSSLIMTPIVWWLQGPSVSTDQFYVRCGLVVISFLTGLGMRIWALMRKRTPGT